MSLINVDQICEIRIYRKSEKLDFTYHPGYVKKCLFGKKEVKSYFTRDFMFDSKKLSAEYIIENYNHCYIEDNKVYYYPHVELHLSNKYVRTKWFKTAEELDKFIDTNEKIVNVKWVEI